MMGEFTNNVTINVRAQAVAVAEHVLSMCRAGLNPNTSLPQSLCLRPSQFMMLEVTFLDSKVKIHHCLISIHLSLSCLNILSSH